MSFKFDVGYLEIKDIDEKSPNGFYIRESWTMSSGSEDPRDIEAYVDMQGGSKSYKTNITSGKDVERFIDAYVLSGKAFLIRKRTRLLHAQNEAHKTAEKLHKDSEDAAAVAACVDVNAVEQFVKQVKKKATDHLGQDRMNVLQYRVYSHLIDLVRQNCYNP
jgi:sucrose-6-phosphate hydrolase SacC (GH32 family)